MIRCTCTDYIIFCKGISRRIAFSDTVCSIQRQILYCRWQFTITECLCVNSGAASICTCYRHSKASLQRGKICCVCHTSPGLVNGKLSFFIFLLVGDGYDSRLAQRISIVRINPVIIRCMICLNHIVIVKISARILLVLLREGVFPCAARKRIGNRCELRILSIAGWSRSRCCIRMRHSIIFRL